jgi:hypothetical protein
VKAGSYELDGKNLHIADVGATAQYVKCICVLEVIELIPDQIWLHTTHFSEPRNRKSFAR